jgi:biotin carboxyl carrier protein
VFERVESQHSPTSQMVTSFFPHTRLDTRVVRDGDTIMAFQRGTQYRLTVPRAKWMDKALGMKDVANSVLAPMPCKVLRVEAQAGQTVEKDQVLVVIESMKMETVIRSPHRGTISRVVHQAGVRDRPYHRADRANKTRTNARAARRWWSLPARAVRRSRPISLAYSILCTTRVNKSKQEVHKTTMLLISFGV